VKVEDTSEPKRKRLKHEINMLETKGKKKKNIRDRFRVDMSFRKVNNVEIIL
jgi:hypothetical protein